MTVALSTSLALEADALGYQAANGQWLIKDASLTLETGAILALAGPNGAGKSTLLRVLCGLLPPSCGTVRVNGVPLTDISDGERSRLIAHVGQFDEPDRRLTIWDYVALGRIPHGRSSTHDENEAAIRAALELVSLTAKAQNPLGRISGGELQRAAIARALCQEPHILFLDEPTNHLDPKAKGELLSLVASRGISCVCVLHELALIPGLASHTALIADGRVAAVGLTDAVLTGDQVRHVFGVDFLHVAHPTEQRLLPVLDIPFTHSTDPKQRIMR